MTRTTLVAALLAVAACGQAPGRVGSGSDPYYVGTVLDIEPEPIDKLDILFVIDDSGSMQGQQAALAAAARDALFGQLAADLGGYLPDLHVGVTTTSAPLAPSSPGSVPGCPTAPVPEEPGQGGVLDTNQCAGVDPGAAYLIDRPDGAGGRIRNYQGDLADVYACMAQRGTGGCGFEHTLESTARAVEGSGPLGNGFHRDDALLLIVIVSDEDDCSAADGALFDDPTAGLTSPLGPRTSFRCFEFGVECAEPPRDFGDKTACVPRTSGFLTPVAELAARIRAAVPDPSRVMVAGIHGGVHGVTVVADPMTPTNPFLGMLCPGTDFEAAPALRLTAFADEFPARWVLAPECLTTMGAKLSRITRAATGVLDRGTCLLGGTPDVDTCTVTRVAAGGARTIIPRCGARDGDCYRLAPDAAGCAYTDHHLRLVMPPALMPRGDRIQVRCGD